MPEVRPAVLRRDPERLALAGGDVGAVGAGRRQDGERDRLDDADEQRAGGVGEPADLGHRLEQAEEVRLAGDDARDRPVVVGEQPLERREVRRARRPAPSATSGISSSSSPPPKYVRERRAVVGMDRLRDEDALAARRPAGHQRRLGGRRGAVVVRRRDDVEVDELGDQRLVLVDALERALADLGLVRRVGRVPLAAEQDLVDRRRRPVAVDARPEERREVGPVAAGQALEPGRELELRLRLRAGRGRLARRASGMSANSSSTLAIPSAASIRSRSPAVCGP